MAQTIQGTATYRERMALPAGAVFEATLDDVSRADAPSETIASQRLTAPGNPPIAFTIAYEPSKILDNHRYLVRAKIRVDGKLLTTDTATPVIARGSPTTVSLLMRRVGTGQAAPPKAAGERPLEGVRWKAVELAGKPTPVSQNPNREAHLVFEAGGRLSGSDGCNRLTGNYKRSGDALTFGQMAMTQMACVDATEIVDGFREAMKGAARFAMAGDRLELFDAAGTRVAAFTAQGPTPAPASPELTGTSWQLVKFQGGDGKTLTPEDRAKYTIEFAAGGQLAARIDCNRGRGTWKSSGPNQLQLGPLALTRALCPPGSLHDQIVKQWGYVRSYVVKDGHLFLSLMADGGIYEFEPVKKG
jgi:heat shock protein HslJ